MRKGLIITAVGRDRPGIVDRLSGTIFRHGCNIEDSRMAILGGSFALIVLVTGPDEALAGLGSALEPVAGELGLTLSSRPTEDAAVADQATRYLPYRLTAVALDHPGIVHRVSHLLADHGVNVAALDTRLTHAPTTGTPVFSLSIEAQVPADLPVARLRELLEEVAGAENLDLEIRAIS